MLSVRMDRKRVQHHAVLNLVSTNIIVRMRSASQFLKAATWLRWVKWVLRRKLHGRRVVVLNMDETSVLSPPNKRRGFFMKLRKGRDNRKAFKRAGQRRCSLMAVICDNPELQKHLPQVLLPRNRKQMEPGKRMKQVYASMGAPMQAWHGSAGSVDSNVLKMWLRTIKKCIEDHMGDAVIVLTMDAHPVHRAEEILRLARKLGIHVLIVQAKCTWFLQTLDVKVFHVLKQTLRRLLMAKEAMESSGVLHWQQHVDAVAQSVQQVLVHRSWERQMTHMGLSVHAVPEHTELGNLAALAALATLAAPVALGS